MVVDYLVYCIQTGKQKLAWDALIEEGFSAEVADAFVDEIEGYHLQDLEKVKTIQEALQMTDEELIDLANTIIRVLD